MAVKTRPISLQELAGAVGVGGQQAEDADEDQDAGQGEDQDAGHVEDKDNNQARVDPVLAETQRLMRLLGLTPDSLSALQGAIQQAITDTERAWTTVEASLTKAITEALGGFDSFDTITIARVDGAVKVTRNVGAGVRRANGAMGAGGAGHKYQYVVKATGVAYKAVGQALDALGVPQGERGKYWDSRYNEIPVRYQMQIDRREVK